MCVCVCVPAPYRIVLEYTIPVPSRPTFTPPLPSSVRTLHSLRSRSMTPPLSLPRHTGRRHQLRIHCARKLGAPIIGDGRYGYGGLPPRLGLRDRLPPEWWALLGEDPRVVALRLQQQAAEQAEAEVEAGAAVAGAGSGGARAGRGGRGRSASPGAARAAVPSVPIMLHARELVIKRPGKSPLVAVAPLPRYVRELMEAAGWPLPRDG